MNTEVYPPLPIHVTDAILLWVGMNTDMPLYEFLNKMFHGD